MKRAQRLKDMSTRHEKRSLVNGNGEQKLVCMQDLYIPTIPWQYVKCKL